MIGRTEYCPEAVEEGDRLRFLEALLALGGEPVALFDPSARILIAAPALAQGAGHPAALLEGHSLEEFGGPAEVAGRLGRAVRAVASEGLASTITEPRLLPGRTVSLVPLLTAGGRVWAVGAMAPASLRTEVGRFLSAANHDLRQPFQAMHLFHHLLTSRLSDPRQLDFADKLGQSITAADHGLAALVTAARLDAGLMVPDRRAFPLALILIPLIEEYRTKAREAGLDLRVHYGMAAGDVAVLSDQYLLELLLRQFLDNAVRFTDAGGVLFGVRQRGNTLRLEVWDTGPGIPETEKKTVWEDFRRLDPPPRGGVAGMGLGLGIVRRISRLLDHPVSVASRSRRGTLASVTVEIA